MCLCSVCWRRIGENIPTGRSRNDRNSEMELVKNATSAHQGLVILNWQDGRLGEGGRDKKIGQRAGTGGPRPGGLPWLGSTFPRGCFLGGFPISQEMLWGLNLPVYQMKGCPGGPQGSGPRFDCCERMTIYTCTVLPGGLSSQSLFASSFLTTC